MTEAVEKLKAQTKLLSPAEKVDLASYLLESLATEEGDEKQWRAEISRRVADIRSGKVVGRALEEVLGELREKYP